MNLIPEKRLDKTGKLVTRHVRSAPVASSAAARLPVPSVAPQKPTRKQSPAAFKLRPQQLEQTRYYGARIRPDYLSPALRVVTDDFNDERTAFTANNVEFYAVLAVAHETDALKMLNDGVRTTEDAIAYMSERGMEPPFDRTALVQEALRRNISPENYRDYFNNANVATVNQDSPYLADAIELFWIMALKDQYHDVSRLICDGKVRLEDIKKIGALKLKGYYRLRDTVPALKRFKEPECPFTHQDIKNILERVQPARRDHRGYKSDYETAIRYLVKYGPEFIASVNINKLNEADRHAIYRQDRMEFAKFTTHFSSAPLFGRDIETLYNAGVDPVRAAELATAGMGVNSIIGVIQEEIPSSIGSGWL